MTDLISFDCHVPADNLETFKEFLLSQEILINDDGNVISNVGHPEWTCYEKGFLIEPVPGNYDAKALNENDLPVGGPVFFNEDITVFYFCKKEPQVKTPFLLLNYQLSEGETSDN